jgi:hypothetical protein
MDYATAKKSKYSSKYSNEERYKIVEKIESLKNNEMYHAVFEILMSDDKSNYSQNCNGVFLNFSAITDKTLDKIVKYLSKITKVSKTQAEEYPNYIPYATGESGPKILGPKLSNHEKKIINRKNIKSLLNEQSDSITVSNTSASASTSTTSTESSPININTNSNSNKRKVRVVGI